VADAWGGSWGSAWGVSWGAGVAPEPEPDRRRGTGGWGAGLHGPRRRRDYSPPTPLSQRDRKLSDLDPLPPKPVIVKASVETPATVLAPLINDDQDLADLMDLQDLGLLN
jgi:hypothetical protein